MFQAIYAPAVRTAGAGAQATVAASAAAAPQPNPATLARRASTASKTREYETEDEKDDVIPCRNPKRKKTQNQVADFAQEKGQI